MTAVDTNELISYYKTHSDNDTRKHFHINRNRLYKILTAANIARHSAEENRAFKLILRRKNLTDEKRRSNSEKISATKAKFWANKTYSFQDADLVDYFKTHTISTTAKYFNINSNDVYFILSRNNVPNHTKKEIAEIRAASQHKTQQSKTTEQKQTEFEQRSARAMAKHDWPTIAAYYKTHSIGSTARKFKVSRQALQRELPKYAVILHTDAENKALAKQEWSEKMHAKASSRTVEEKQAIAQKSKQTKLMRYGDENYRNAEKAARTNIARYGAVNVFASDEIKEKIKATNKQRYGTEAYLSSADSKEKTIKTNMERYGVQWYPQTEKYQSEARRSYYVRLDALRGCRRKNYTVNEIQFDSFPEVCFFLYHDSIGSNIERGGIRYEYECKGKKHWYYPDFVVDGQAYEIKGNQFLAEDGTWRNPYDRSQDEEYEAKRRCAIDNGVKILYNDDYKKYIDWFYGSGLRIDGIRRRQEKCQ